MAKSTNYRGIHISVTYNMGYDYYEISQINKGKKWNDKTLFATLKEAKMYIDEHYDELIKNESKKTIRKAIKEKMDSKSEEIYYLLYRLFELNLIQTNDYDEDQFDEITDYIEKNGVDKSYKNEAYKLAMQYINHDFSNGKEYKEIVKTFLDLFDLQVNTHSVEWNIISESKKSARKSIKEQFVGKGEGGYRKPDKTKFNSGICLDSNGVKHTVIFDTRVEDFIVWVDDDNYLMWYVSSPQSLLNNLAESDLDENLILNIVALWEKLPKKRIKK